MADVPFVPKGYVLKSCNGVAAENASKASQALAGDRVTFVRHGARSFLAFGEKLFGFEHLGALKVAEFGGPAFDAGADESQCADEFGVDVALNDLGGDGRRAQAEFLADVSLNFWGKMGTGAHSAGKFAHCHGFARGFEAFESAAKFVIHERHFQAKSGWLSMDTMAAANHGDELEFPGFGRDDFSKGADVIEQNVGGLDHLDGESSVDNVAAGEAKMQPAAGRLADVFGDVGCESDDIVVEGLLKFLAALDGERGAGFHLGEVFLGEETLSAEGFASEKLDLKPDFELALFAPDFAHFSA